MQKTAMLQKAIDECLRAGKLLTQSELSAKLKVSTTKLRSLFGTAKTTQALLRQFLLCDKKGKITSDELKKEVKDIESRDISKQLVLLATENKKLRKENEKFKEHHLLEEQVVDIVKDAVMAVPPVKFAPFKPIVKSGETKKELLELWSDFHGGSYINPEEMGYLNQYNSKIMMKRFQYLIDYTLHKAKKFKSIDTINIAVLGDMVSGNIHEELEITNDMDIVTGVFALASMMTQGILELASHFKHVKVFGIPGNHGRIQKQVRFKKKYVNWDWVVYKTMEISLSAQKNVSCSFPKSLFVIQNILGDNHLFLHGDQIKSWNGIPFYGINRTKAQLSDVLSSKDIKIRNMYLGHFHNTGQLDRALGEIIINGSMSGGDEYSLGKLFTMSPAKQLLLCVEEGKGTTWRDPIIVDHADNIVSDDDLRYAQYRF